MSGSNMKWEPNRDSGIDVDCDNQLIELLRNRYNGFPVYLDADEDTDYLQGLADAKVKGAGQLLDALTEEDGIKLNLD